MSRLLQIAKSELHRIIKDKILCTIIFILPVGFSFFYLSVYQKEVLRELPVGIIDIDNSFLSRRVIQMAESSPAIKIEGYYTSIEEIKEAFRNGEIEAAIYLPKGFERNIKAGKSSSVIFYKNSSNLIISNVLLKEAGVIVRTASAGILLKKLENQNYSRDKALYSVNPVRLHTNSLYNPTYSYLNYLSPGLISFTFQMLIMLGASTIFYSIKDIGSAEAGSKLRSNNIALQLTGKVLAHSAIHILNMAIILFIIFPFYNIPIAGSAALLLLFFGLFILCCVILGASVSVLIENRLKATEAIVFINTPAFIFSGFTFPLWGMPFVHKLFAQLMPFTHFLSGFIKIYQMDSPFNFVLPETAALSLFTLAGLTIISITIKNKSAAREIVQTNG